MPQRAYGAQSHGNTRLPLRVLIVDSYTSKGREELKAGGCTIAATLYADMLRRVVRRGNLWAAGIETVHFFPADVPDPSGQHVEEDALARLPSTDDLLTQFDGVAWTGCSLCIHGEQDAPLVRPQIELARRIFDAGIPQFGSCWAAQIAVTAAGVSRAVDFIDSDALTAAFWQGSCEASPNGREQGIGRKVALTAAGRGHPMFTGKPDVFDVYQSHTDEITGENSLLRRLSRRRSLALVLYPRQRSREAPPC